MGQVQLNKGIHTLNTTNTSSSTEKKLSDRSVDMSAFQVIANNPPIGQKGPVISGGGMDGFIAKALDESSQSDSMAGNEDYNEKLDDAKTQLHEFIKIYKGSMAEQRAGLAGKSLLSNLGDGVGQSLEGTYDGAKGTAKEAYELFTLFKNGITNGGDFSQFNKQIEEYANSAKESYQSLKNAAEITKFIIENPELQNMLMEGAKDITGDMNTDQMTVMVGKLIGDMIISAATLGAGKAVKAIGKGEAAKKLLDSLNQLVQASSNGKKSGIGDGVNEFIDKFDQASEKIDLGGYSKDADKHVHIKQPELLSLDDRIGKIIKQPKDRKDIIKALETTKIGKEIKAFIEKGVYDDCDGYDQILNDIKSKQKRESVLQAFKIAERYRKNNNGEIFFEYKLESKGIDIDVGTKFPDGSFKIANQAKGSTLGKLAKRIKKGGEELKNVSANERIVEIELKASYEEFQAKGSEKAFKSTFPDRFPGVKLIINFSDGETKSWF